ncbi:MAG: acyloxyacyl hydrolase [Chlorobiaceae bacterium]|jgi:lipid A 3-O-deacylase|nr:acyloxyacyl hydrolase [Chlorobiaceae bacterium]
MRYFNIAALYLQLVFFTFTLVQKDVNAASLEKGQKSGCYLNEIGIGSGYSSYQLKKEPHDLTVYPLFMRIGFNINSLAGMEGCTNTLQLILEPFVNSISYPEAGVETGCSAGLRYLYNVSVPLNLYMEGSVAPMFLSIQTHELGNPAFNFLTQLGLGLQYNVTGRTALFTGYRFRHISHGGFVKAPNTGINSNAVVAGFSWLY